MNKLYSVSREDITISHRSDLLPGQKPVFRLFTYKQKIMRLMKIKCYKFSNFFTKKCNLIKK